MDAAGPSRKITKPVPIVVRTRAEDMSDNNNIHLSFAAQVASTEGHGNSILPPSVCVGC
jgi:hypothetical protein